MIDGLELIHCHTDKRPYTKKNPNKTKNKKKTPH